MSATTEMKFCPRCKLCICHYCDCRSLYNLDHWDYHMRRIRLFVRHKNIRQELIEALYHPDRLERMVASYGEVWADEHLPC